MTLSALTSFLLQSVLLVCAMALSQWMRAPWPVLVAMGLVWVATIFCELAAISRKPHLWKVGLAFLRASTVVVFGGLIFYWGDYCVWFMTKAEIVLLAALAILPGGFRIVDEACRRQWRMWFAFWAFPSAAILLTTSYLENQRGFFYVGLLICLTLLLLCKCWFRLNALGIQATNTLILLVIGVPVLSLLLSPADQFGLVPTLEQEPYSYEFDREDPAAYARWWRYSQGQFRIFSAAIGRKSVRLRPNSKVPFFHSQIPINSKGFRGREISDEKGDDYRIVALGESTTFGLTMEQEDKSWPAILEQMIQERLKPQRRVRVINAGVPGFSLKENLERLPNQILPLHPDMIISYHGINGFPLVYEGMPPIHGKLPPAYRPRSLTLLADVEYRLKVIGYRKRYTAKSDFHPAFVSSPLESEYARLYRQLIRATRTNDIRLVLATFSMAVNNRSPRDVVDFYRLIGLEVDRQIIANQAHSIIVQQLAHDNPDVCLVDTCPELDGQNENYIDLVHFTQGGREKLAELFFAGIRKTLEEDLGRTEFVDPTDNAISARGQNLEGTLPAHGGNVWN